MKNNFLDRNERINEAIRAFRAEPSGDTYRDIFQAVHDRMKEDGHFLIPVWRPELET